MHVQVQEDLGVDHTDATHDRAHEDGGHCGIEHAITAYEHRRSAGPVARRQPGQG